MSLDVYLHEERYVTKDKINFELFLDDPLYDANITHNLGQMAEVAGIYEALWRPHRLKAGYNHEWNGTDDEYLFETNCSPVRAKDISYTISKGLDQLKLHPGVYEKYNSPNGWGLYKHFVPFVEKYLDALEEYPDSIVKVSR